MGKPANAFGFDDIDFFAPGRVEPFSLPESDRVCLLTVLDRAMSIKSFETALAWLQTESLAARTLWLLFYLPEFGLALETLTAQLEDSGELEIILVPAAETDLPALLAVCHALLDPGLHREPPLTFYRTLAMDKPVICAPAQPAGMLPVEGLMAVADAWQLQQVLAQEVPVGLRGRLIQKLGAAEPEAFQTWLSPQLDWLAGNYAELKLTSVFYWGRSGSTLISSLLEGHPETVMIGAGTFSAISLFSNVWNFLRQTGLNTLAELLEHFCEGRRRENMLPELQELALFTEQDPEFEVAVKGYFHILVQVLGQRWGVTLLQQQIRKVFLVCLHYAYALAMGQGICGRWLIVFQAHWCEDLEQLSALCQDFPGFKMLGTFRHPAQGMYSFLASHCTKSQRPWHEPILSGLYLIHYRHMLMGWKLAEHLIGSPVYPVVLEKLHAQPEATMRELADHLGIAWDPCLLRSSCDGRPYTVSSGVHQQVNARMPVFDPQRVNYPQWRNQFSELDIFVLEGLMHEPMQKLLGQPVSAFQQTLALLLLFLPMRLEWNAFKHALHLRDEDMLKSLVLGMVERYYYSLLFACGYAFKSVPPSDRLTPQALLGLE